MLLPDMVTWLVNDGVATAGVTLFRGSMPSSPDLCIVLYEYGGRANEPHMGQRTINLEFPSLHVEVRGVRDDQDTPRLLIQQVVTSFAKIGDTDINGTKYGEVSALQPAFPLMPDADLRYIYAINFKTQKGYSTT